MPLLTVLMPVYNSERFLADAIDSILNQTFTDFEFLIIDDCSTDSSPAIIKTYSDPRIRYYRNERNLGISESLNRGIQLATCEWIARMDSDDYSYPDRLQRQYEFLKDHPDGALFSCSVRVITEAGEFVRIDKFRPEFYYYNLLFICWIYHPTVLYLKQAVLDVGAYEVPYSEDFDLFWKLSRTYKLYHLPEILLDYRVTSQSLHQVEKRSEYEQAQREQVVRNIQYYTGTNFKLEDAELECLRHNFEPLLKQNQLKSIAVCIRKLDEINRAVFSKEKNNPDIGSIKAAALFKRDYILFQYLSHLSRTNQIRLLIQTGSWKFLRNLLLSFIKKRLLGSRLL